MSAIARLFRGDDWKRVFAWTVVYGYAYNIVAWPLVFWLTTIGTSFTPFPWPAPPLVPWEHLAVATGNLAVVGAVQIFRDKQRADVAPGLTE